MQKMSVAFRFVCNIDMIPRFPLCFLLYILYVLDLMHFLTFLLLHVKRLQLKIGLC